MQPISNDQIEAYKSYFKRVNIAQYGASVLLNALNEGDKTADPFSGESGGSGDTESIFPEQPATLSINTDAVYKKMWKDLEALIKEYEEKNPGIKGKYVVAVNADTADGQPAFKVAAKDDLLALIADKDQKSSSDLMDQHPVQVFKSGNLDVAALSEAPVVGLEDIVAAFMAQNKGVFQFLAAQSAGAADQASL
jgi:hypothetical protein